MVLDLTPDELLGTTRSVRRRLDFSRPVEREVIEECLTLALRAPTGSNHQGWQWVVVTEPDTRTAIAEHYGRNFDVYMNMRSAQYPEGDARADRQAAVRESAQFLRAHMHEAPALVIPLQEGRIDGCRHLRPGLVLGLAPAGGVELHARPALPRPSARRGPRSTSRTRRTWPSCSASPSTAAPRRACSPWPTPSARTSSAPDGSPSTRSSTGNAGDAPPPRLPSRAVTR